MRGKMRAGYIFTLLYPPGSRDGTQWMVYPAIITTADGYEQHKTVVFVDESGAIHVEKEYHIDNRNSLSCFVWENELCRLRDEISTNKGQGCFMKEAQARILEYMTESDTT